MITTNTRTKALDSILTNEEFLAMLQKSKDATDRAILCLGLLGLRANEISEFKGAWCDLSKRIINVPPRAAKRGKGRSVPFGKIHIVAEIVTSFVVCQPEGPDISRIAIWNRVKRLASAAAIGHPVTPHGLRASGACMFARAGFSITGLQHHFGWSELRTAQHYIQASGASALRDMDEHGKDIL